MIIIGFSADIPIIERKGTGYWTLEKKRRYHENLRKSLVSVGADLEELETYGLVEAWIKANDKLANYKGDAEITYIPSYLKNIPRSSRREVPIDVIIRSEKKEKRDYPIRLLLQKDFNLSNKKITVYRTQPASEIEHVCEASKYDTFKCCYHKVFTDAIVYTCIQKNLDDAGIKHVRIDSFYKDYEIFPMSPDILDKWDTVKHLSSIPRKTELQEYILSAKKFDTQNNL